MWIVSQEYHALLQIDKAAKTTTVEVFFQKYPFHKPEGYYSGIISGDYIVCMPAAAEDVVIYSLNDQKLVYLPLADADQACQEEYNPTYKFFRGYAYGGNVLAFGATYPALLHINPEEKTIDYVDEWVADAERYIPQDGASFYFGDGHVRLAKELFIPMNCCGAFLVANLETLQCRLLLLPGELDGIEGVTKIEDKLCFIGRKEELYYLCLWHPKDKAIKKVRLPYRGKSFAWISFSKPLFWRSKVYLIPQTADHFYVVDLESEEISIEENFEIMLCKFPAEKQEIKVGGYKQNGNIIVFQTWWDYKWHRYNLDTWEHEDYELMLDNETCAQYEQQVLCDRLIDEKNVISEKVVPLSIFLGAIKNIKQPYDEGEAFCRTEG